MILQYSISDTNFKKLNDALRISKKEWDEILRNGNPENILSTNAGRIIMARKSLGLSNVDSDACYDYKLSSGTHKP